MTRHRGFDRDLIFSSRCIDDSAALNTDTLAETFSHYGFCIGFD